jgi:hypothetical protein
MCLLQGCDKAEDSPQNFFYLPAINRRLRLILITCVALDINRFSTIISEHSTSIMANADSPDPSKDLLPVDKNDEEVDPLAPAPEPKLPTRKDASLKEFLAKMDDYAPIVSEPISCTMFILTWCKRFPMLLPTTTLQKPVFLHRPKPTHAWLAFLRSLLKSSSQTLLRMLTNILGFGLQTLLMPTIRWAI